MIVGPAVTLESASREFCTVKIFSGVRYVRTKLIHVILVHERLTECIGQSHVGSPVTVSVT